MRVRDDVGGGGELHTDWKPGASCASTSGAEQPRHFLIELHRDEIAFILESLNMQNLHQVVRMSRDVPSHVIVSST